MSGLDTKGVIAILIVIGSLGLTGIYAYRGQTPDGVVVAIISAALLGVIGFYFGHANGRIDGLAAATTSLALQAQEKAGAAAAPTQVVVAPVTTMPAAAPEGRPPGG